MRNFRDIEIWNLSRGLVEEIYFLMKIMPDEEKHGVTSQIKRSVLSIPSNIAEGCAKKSNKDFSRFLETRPGFCYELESQWILCIDFDLIPEKILEIKLHFYKPSKRKLHLS